MGFHRHELMSIMITFTVSTTCKIPVIYREFEMYELARLGITKSLCLPVRPSTTSSHPLVSRVWKVANPEANLISTLLIDLLLQRSPSTAVLSSWMTLLLTLTSVTNWEQTCDRSTCAIVRDHATTCHVSDQLIRLSDFHVSRR